MQRACHRRLTRSPGERAGLPADVRQPPSEVTQVAELPADPSLEDPVGPVLDEVRALYDAVLPATELYLTTQPLMRERLHELLAGHIKAGADVGAPAEIDKGQAPKRAARK